MNDHFVSVIIPVYNGEMYLEEAVESIKQQNYEPLEIILVDDGSTDSTAKIAENMHGNIRYVYQSNSGPAAARNRGLKMARGNIMAFLDADDLWPATKLHIQVLRLIKKPLLEVVMGRTKFIKMPGAPDVRFDIRFEGPENTLPSVPLASGLFKKSVFDKVGRFDESLQYSEEHDWFLRARELDVSIEILKDITLYYRIHDKNMSHKEDLWKQFMIKVLKKSLDRRRKYGKRKIRELSRWLAYDEEEKSGL
jgi:glycosyltransferase involved in cell wall biosynthesis